MRQEDTLRLRSARWPASGRPSTPLTVAGIMMTALFLSGCTTSRRASVGREESVRLTSVDTLLSEVRREWTETVPREESLLEIAIADLGRLPENAEYRSENGRASASVRNRDGTIVVRATCDSLLRLCEYYELQASRHKRALERRENEDRMEKERRSNPVRMPLIAYIAGVATGIVLTILSYMRYGRKQ